jgi:uroporphyrinogen decarboxylase
VTTNPTPSSQRVATMTGRERMLAALAFQPVDIVPLQIHPSPAGVFEHGQKLIDLLRACGHDFDDLSQLRVPVVPPEDFDADGRYHKITTDAWGTTWEYRIYGIWGHRIGYPLADMANLAAYRPPAVARLQGEELVRARADAAAHRQRYFHVGGGISLFETMQSLRPFEDVLIDILQDTPEINRLADLLVEHYAVVVENALAVDADAIAAGDDFGTQQALMISPTAWRRFFKPRYRALFEPVVRAGKHVLFHSCGCIGPLLEDLREVGASSIWPQLPLFNHRELAQQCRALGLAVQMHPDRGDLMQRGTPTQVRDYVLRLVEEFDPLAGGAWLYLEIDPGFPWANVEALVQTAIELRQPRSG